MRLKDKVAIITGAGSGIGRGIAIAFSEEGAKTVICDINPEGLDETSKGLKTEHLKLIIDVSKERDIETMVSETIKKFKRIDILINNAGIEVTGNLTDITEEQWYKLMDVNLKGVYFGMKHALPYMMENMKGKIINISSLAAYCGAPMMTLYSTAKAGIIGLTKSAAVEYAAYKININAICPGFVYSGMTKPVLDIEEMKNVVLDRTPVGVIGEPYKDIAPLAVYLASDESDFMTGQAIIIDGGYSVV
jgi:NAD(P)-dependent dehydrogenase (short-subunit alcohol dehydrogenase family)